MNMDTAAKTLNLQQNLKVAELEEIILQDYMKNDKMWSESPTGPYTTTFGEGTISVIKARSKFYTARRVGVNQFQVSFNRSDHSDEEAGEVDGMDFQEVPIPRFSRICEVNIESDGTMLCDCARFEGCGIFCE